MKYLLIALLTLSFSTAALAEQSKNKTSAQFMCGKLVGIVSLNKQQQQAHPTVHPQAILLDIVNRKTYKRVIVFADKTKPNKTPSDYLKALDMTARTAATIKQRKIKDTYTCFYMFASQPDAKGNAQGMMYRFVGAKEMKPGTIKML